VAFQQTINHPQPTLLSNRSRFCIALSFYHISVTRTKEGYYDTTLIFPVTSQINDCRRCSIGSFSAVITKSAAGHIAELLSPASYPQNLLLSVFLPLFFPFLHVTFSAKFSHQNFGRISCPSWSYFCDIRFPTVVPRYTI